MRIKSNYKDYYDHLAQYGREDRFQYIRPLFRQENVKFEPLPKDFQLNSWPHYGFYDVIFVGEEAFPFVRFQKREEWDYSKSKAVVISPETYVFDYTQLTYNDKYAFFFNYWNTGKAWQSELVQKYGPVFRVFAPQYLEYCTGDIPSGHVAVETNICLANYKFHKVLDSNQAWQNIELWFANKAYPEKPIPVMSDDIKIEQHGFDLKQSFRKRKGS